MRRPVTLAALVIGALLVDGSLSAHHGRGNRYDMDAEIPVEGTVREVVWRNPHIAILVDAPDRNGEDATWVIEHSNVSTLARLGYHRNTLRPGQNVTVYVNPGSNGEAIGLCQRIVLEDGSVIFVRGATVD
ncbi:MAG: hypothetical protein GWN29_10610 [Gammaproteobacteria bacterium]|nr:hypothetical protein [Gammaproteobacteria bacterium]